MNATMSNNGGAGTIMGWLAVLCFVAFCVCGVVVVFSQHAVESHASEPVNADAILKAIGGGICRPVPYWCDDSTVKVLCQMPGMQLPSMLVLSTTGYTRAQFLSGDVNQVTVVTGFQPRTENYIRNATTNCERIDLPWLTP